jgi:hypothetical protein
MKVLGCLSRHCGRLLNMLLMRQNHLVCLLSLFDIINGLTTNCTIIVRLFMALFHIVTRIIFINQILKFVIITYAIQLQRRFCCCPYYFCYFWDSLNSYFITDFISSATYLLKFGSPLLVWAASKFIIIKLFSQFEVKQYRLPN